VPVEKSRTGTPGQEKTADQELPLPELTFLTDTEIYDEVILKTVPAARSFVWLATSDLKDLYVHSGRRMAPFLQTLSELVDRGVSLRLLHAKEPGPAFRKDFDRFPNLIEGLERLLCPRVHFKIVIVDGLRAYCGSANLTGAGMGAKSKTRRNFENGIITSDPGLVKAIMDQFDRVWMGSRCTECGRIEFCAEARGMREEIGVVPVKKRRVNLGRRTLKKQATDNRSGPVP
jgi:phosphatidylserine/phosphatidylglycerophosphate/cardiolipin synthase-like enzyme